MGIRIHHISGAVFGFDSSSNIIHINTGCTLEIEYFRYIYTYVLRQLERRTLNYFRTALGLRNIAEVAIILDPVDPVGARNPLNRHSDSQA